jgi:hypothetical protein
METPLRKKLAPFHPMKGHFMPPRKPGSVTAAAVMAIIYGSLGLLCGFCGLISLVAQEFMAQNINFNMAAAGGDPGVAAFLTQFDKEMKDIIRRDIPLNAIIQVAESVLSLLFAALILAGGIGLLKMKRWSRKLTLRSCLAEMALSSFQVVYLFAVTLPVTIRAIDEAMPKALLALPPGAALPPNFQESQELANTLGLAFAGIVVAICIIYFFLIVCLLSRRTVRDAFASLDQAGIDSAAMPGGQHRDVDDDWKPRSSPPPTKDPGPDWGIKPKDE